MWWVGVCFGKSGAVLYNVADARGYSCHARAGYLTDMATTTTRVHRNRFGTATRVWFPELGRWLAALLVGLVLWGVWHISANRVRVEVGGLEVELSTHRKTVGALLLDLGILLHENDRVSPPLDTLLAHTQKLSVARARPVQLVVDGRTLQSASWGETPRAVLADAGIATDPYDRVMMGDRQLGLDDPLPPRREVAAHSFFAPMQAWSRLAVVPLQLRVVRALPVVVDDGGLPFVVRTTSPTIGEALREAEITIYLGDRVVPSLGSAVSHGVRVSIQRSIPIALDADGRTIKTRTRGDTVADALTALKIGVAGMDRVDPAVESPLYEGMRISVTRVNEEIEILEEIAPFETVYVADANLPIDSQQIVNVGVEGVTRTRYRVRYEDGQEVARKLEDTWVAQGPAERVIAYGQQVEPKTFAAPDGTQVTYWRQIRMLASSYSAGTAGVSPDKSYYGRTYTGEVMRHGIVAVDPSVIPLRSQVYVPGYGMGDALDIGSAVRARRIDLGFDDSNLELWNRWVDVYLLWPPPPASQITWVLPNWPRPPQ